MHRPEPTVELCQILPVLEVLEHVTPPPLLLGQAVEHAVTLEQAEDVGEAVVQAGIGTQGRHG